MKMLQAKSWKSMAVSLVVVMMALFCALAASAATLNVSPHQITSQGAYVYYDGNGYSIAAGGTLIANFTFDNSYQYDVGYQSVTSGNTHICDSGAGTSASYAASVPKTDLYRVYLKNCSSVPMRVTGGYISYNN